MTSSLPIYTPFISEICRFSHWTGKRPRFVVRSIAGHLKEQEKTLNPSLSMVLRPLAVGCDDFRLLCGLDFEGVVRQLLVHLDI